MAIGRLGTAAGVVAFMAVAGSCAHQTGKPSGPSPVPATAPTTVPPVTPTPTPTPMPTPTPTPTLPAAAAPLSLDVVPIAFAGPRGDIATVPPVPAVPSPGAPAATVEVTGGWVGRFRIDGSDPRVSVSCSAQPEPRAHIEVAALNYAAATTAGGSEYDLPDGGWSLRVTRTGPLTNPAAVEVDISAVDAAGEQVDIAGTSTGAKPTLGARGTKDNSTIAFSFVGTAVPGKLGLYEKVAGVAVTGTVVCPGPLPELTR